MQQHFFNNIISRRRRSDLEKDHQKRAIIQNLVRSYSLKKSSKPVQNECTTLSRYGGISRPNLLAITSTPFSSDNESKFTSKLSMRDEWRRINCSFPVEMPFISKLNQTSSLPKMPSSVQFLGNSSMNYLDASISPCRPLRSISAFGGITSSTASVSKLNGNSALRIAEPLVEEPASDGEDGESQSNKHNSELTDSEPEEEDGILIERAIPIAKGCDSTNISSRVFLDQQYLNSLFNRKVTLHMSEISELFSYENEADVVDGNSKSAKTSNKTIKNENISNGKCSGKTTKLNGQLISTSHETHKNARSTLKSSKTASSSLTECNVVYDKPSASKLPPLNIKTSTDLSSPASPQSPTSPLSTSSLVSPLSPPSASAYSRKKVALTGAKKCVLESYSIETDKTTSKMSVKTAEAQQTKHFHPSSFLNRLTSEMIDSGALLSEDEEDKQKELKKIKLKNPLKKEKPPVIGANKANAKVKSSAMKRSFEEFKEEGNTLICSPKSASSECRRSARNRVCPLNYWTGQRPLYHVTMDNRGNPLKTLVGVQPGNAEPKKKKTFERKKHLKNDKNQKMVNIFNLSIDHPRFAKKFTNTESHDHEHVLAYNQVEFRESSKSPGVFTALTKKASNIAFGKLKFTPKSVKKRTKTGNYVSHFNVVYGTLLLKLENEKVGSIIKTGFYFHVGEQTNYTLTNLRNDEAMIDFTIIKEN